MSSSNLPLQGMQDIAYPEIATWQTIEQKAREVLALYNFSEVRTPILEKIEVFTHSLGDTTDIVTKEMYNFEDRGGRHICLRPEGTASTMRYVAKLGRDGQQERIYYIGPMFRCEKQQAGRYRQFHQVGVESIGAPNPLHDAEMIAMQKQLVEAWGLEGVCFNINSLGLAEDRKRIAAGLREKLLPIKDQLSEDAQRQLEHNVFRVLDSKDPAMQEIINGLPPMREFMSDESKAYFDEVLKNLDEWGIDAKVNNRLVRGLDYYVHTVWELTCEGIGAQNALSGGGRYQIQSGKNNIEGVGFGIGIERVIMALGEVLQEASVKPGVFLVAQNEEAFTANKQLLNELRRAGVAAQMSYELKGVKAQMKQANRCNFSHVIMRGEEELAQDSIALKDMQSGEQELVAADDLIARLTALL